MQELVSVIIPTHNRADYLEKAIKSILNQTYKNYEIIVVDGASNDDTEERVKRIIQEYNADKIIKYFRFEKDPGVSACRKKGFELSKGKYILFLDDDEELLPHALETLVNVLSKLPPKIGAVSARYIDQNGNIYSRASIDKGRVTYIDVITGKVKIYKDFIGLLRREVFNKVSIDERATKGFEILYTLEILKYYDKYIIPDIVAVYHTDSKNRLSSVEGLFRNAEERAKTLEAILEKYSNDWKKYNPKMYAHYLFETGLHWILCGKSKYGRRYLLESLRYDFKFRTLLVYVVSFIGSAPIKWIIIIKNKLRR